MAQFETLEKDGLHLITCPPTVESLAQNQLEAMIKIWLIATVDCHILDFRQVVLFKPNAYRYFVLFNQALKANGKTLYCINISPKLMPQLRDDGLTSVFVPVATLEEAKRRSQPNRPMVDVEFINPFINATRTVLEVQAQTPLTPGKAYLRKPSEKIPTEIAGVIALSCTEFSGSISICFRAEVFLKIYETMVGEKHEEINSEIQDAAGELLNMIFGQAETTLNGQKGYTLDKALPTVLVGDRLVIHHQSRSPAIILPFESPAGGFHLEILVDRS